MELALRNGDVKRKRLVWFAALIVIATATLYLLFANPREPLYKGKPLTYWLQGYLPNSEHANSQSEADEAILKLGTNAIPTLLRLLHAKDSNIKIKVIDIAKKQRLFKIHFVPAWEWNLVAMRGFERLGASASNSVPNLVALFKENISEASQSCAARSLGALGPAAREAIPFLIEASGDVNRNVRHGAVLALAKIHAEPEVVVPILLARLSDPAEEVRLSAVEGLGAFKCFPVLVGLLTNEDWFLQTAATNELEKANWKRSTILK